MEAAQYVTLGLGREIFGIEVVSVREILDYRPITALPSAPTYLLGMIDVRGSTVPVLDLRVRLGLSRTEVTGQTRILVLEVHTGQGARLLGLVADRVYEVTELDHQIMEPPPEIGVRWRSDYIKGVGRRGEAFVIVFDLDRLLTSDETMLLALPQDAA